MKVEQLMTRSPTRCTTCDHVSRAAALMATFDVQALPVTDRSGQIVGIVTEGDLDETDAGDADPCVCSVMTCVSETCSPDDSVSSVTASERPCRLPVTDGGFLVGLLILDSV